MAKGDIMETNETEDFFASWLYGNLMSIRSWFLPTAPAQFLHPHATKVGAVLATALAEIDRTIIPTEDPLVFHAPGPWHAALYCQMLQHNLSVAGGRLLFRGQRDYSWPLTPSILRDPSKVIHESARTAIFTRLLSAMSFNTSIDIHPFSQTRTYQRIGDQSYLAAAQHYGLKTYLLDFTTDPDVAVRFATGGAESGNGMSSIFILGLDDALANGLKITLPPPFVRRLHLQRGVFIEAKDTLLKSDLKIREIRFPRQTATFSENTERFEVRREGGIAVDILPESPEFKALIQATDDLILGGSLEPSPDDIEKIARALKTHFFKNIQDHQGMWFEYVDTFEDMLYALAYTIDLDQKLSLNFDIFGEIVKSNIDVSCSIASLYRAIPKQFPGVYPKEKVEYMQRMAVFIDQVASNIGYDHHEAELRYREAMGLPR